MALGLCVGAPMSGHQGEQGRAVVVVPQPVVGLSDGPHEGCALEWPTTSTVQTT